MKCNANPACRRRDRQDGGQQPDGPLVLHAGSPRGGLWFRLLPHQGGLYVEREEIGGQGRRCLQSVLFLALDEFDRWCGSDPVRFDHPVLYVELRRQAARALEQDARGGSTTGSQPAAGTGG